MPFMEGALLRGRSTSGKLSKHSMDRQESTSSSATTDSSSDDEDMIVEENMDASMAFQERKAQRREQSMRYPCCKTLLNSLKEEDLFDE